jgi:hypothetical protein
MDRSAMPQRKIVEYRDRESVLDQLLDSDAPNIAGAPRDQDLHELPPLSISSAAEFRSASKL